MTDTKKRFYVTMTWDNFPEGGSFGTVVEADTQAAAEFLCREEMAQSRDEGDPDSDSLETWGDEWEVIDCFDLDEFVAQHQRPPAQALIDQDIHTILAALRYYQLNRQGDPIHRSMAVHRIATNDGEQISLDDGGIDDLCERINSAGWVNP